MFKPEPVFVVPSPLRSPGSNRKQDLPQEQKHKFAKINKPELNIKQTHFGQTETPMNTLLIADFIFTSASIEM
jgi:hypothetical protein